MDRPTNAPRGPGRSGLGETSVGVQCALNSILGKIQFEKKKKEHYIKRQITAADRTQRQ
jgi:hypothetical protein